MLTSDFNCILSWFTIFSSLKSVVSVMTVCCVPHQAEQDLRMTQSEFDRQAEITRLLLEGVSSTHVRTLTSDPTTRMTSISACLKWPPIAFFYSALLLTRS